MILHILKEIGEDKWKVYNSDGVILASEETLAGIRGRYNQTLHRGDYPGPGWPKGYIRTRKTCAYHIVFEEQSKPKKTAAYRRFRSLYNKYKTGPWATEDEFKNHLKRMWADTRYHPTEFDNMWNLFEGQN